ncbi:hypothetical protein GCM10011348_17080 [Marinobacterium nitratireducens]|uniref:Uncharacterized protein n=1 Tax=Marinobacterium nitratireducens TaxID=518897 RepID=A0A917ZBZ4_9GAMM|nr:hypothetical protein [Marinobacterium nitratireducens]GGO80433.1 hypothetical protein GCM10011348_17080 [Marinobacterium nitratireducens]
MLRTAALSAMCKKMMRNFSKLEKQIILRMIELDGISGPLNVLSNIYHSFPQELNIPNYCYIDVKSESDVTLKLKSDLFNSGSIDLNSIDEKISKMMLSAVMLFEHLESEGLAYFVGDIGISSIGEICSDEQYITFDSLEKEIKILIYKYTRKRIFVTESLKVLSESGSKSEEVIRHEIAQASTKKQLKYTQFALAFTFLGLLVSIFLPMYSVSDINIKNTPIKMSLDESRLNIIKNDLDELLTQIKETRDLIDIEKNKNNTMDEKIMETSKMTDFLVEKIDALNYRLSKIQSAHNKSIQPTANASAD